MPETDNMTVKQLKKYTQAHSGSGFKAMCSS